MTEHDHQVQNMMAVRHLLSELRNQLNPGTVLEASAVAEAVDKLVTAGIHPGILEMNIKQWKAVNKVTTEYKEFDQNCQTALEHLDKPSTPST